MSSRYEKNVANEAVNFAVSEEVNTPIEIEADMREQLLMLRTFFRKEKANSSERYKEKLQDCLEILTELESTGIIPVLHIPRFLGCLEGHSLEKRLMRYFKTKCLEVGWVLQDLGFAICIGPAVPKKPAA